MNQQPTIQEQRRSAREQGLKRFHATTPCVRCATTERYVSTTACVQCQRNLSTDYNSRHCAQRLAYAATYYSDIHHRLTEAVRSWLYRINLHAGTSYTGDPWDYVPYTVEDLQQHLQQYLDHHGWDWEDWGEVWHIDHKTSVVDFINDNNRDPAQIHALSNVHAIHVYDNRRKYSKNWTVYLRENPDRAIHYQYDNGDL